MIPHSWYHFCLGLDTVSGLLRFIVNGIEVVNGEKKYFQDTKNWKPESVIEKIAGIRYCYEYTFVHSMESSGDQHLDWGSVTFLVTKQACFLWDFNMLVPELAGVNWLWPFMVLGLIYGSSNFGHNFCLKGYRVIFNEWKIVHSSESHLNHSHPTFWSCGIPLDQMLENEWGTAIRKFGSKLLVIM